jgi:hypothetical protein
LEGGITKLDLQPETYACVTKGRAPSIEFLSEGAKTEQTRRRNDSQVVKDTIVAMRVESGIRGMKVE